jgi:hypothetical protein
LTAVHGGVERVVEVEPFVGGRWFAEEGVVLEWLFGVGSKAVYLKSVNRKGKEFR